ncbi:MAG: four helix bundle protein [Gemmatimonadota bacterium]
MAGRVFFDFKNLDVYRAAVDFYALACALAARIPRNRFFVTDQFLRAALSILLNTGEGAGPLTPAQKADHFRRAHGSATECAAILDALVVMKVITVAECERHEQLLARIAAMLTKLAQLHGRRSRTKTNTNTQTQTKTPRAPGRSGSAR